MRQRTRSRSVRRSLCALAAVLVGVLLLAVPAGAFAGTGPHSAGSNAPKSKPHGEAAPRSNPSDDGLPVFTPSFHCPKPGTDHSVDVAADLSDVHVRVKKESKPTRLVFSIKGSPQFTLALDFAGSVDCSASVETSLPIADTGLTLEIGPRLVFSASGKVGAYFTWKPSIDVGFTIDRHGFVDRKLSFTNGKGIGFNGRGSASLKLDLDATVETEGGSVGVTGSAGPTITAKVSESSKDHKTCWSGDLQADADFGAFVDVLGFVKHDWHTGELPLSKAKKLAGGCTSIPRITFDGAPGTGAPPATLGQYTMKPFAADTTAVGTLETTINGPTGPIYFDNALSHELVADGWETWSNDYTGSVYEDSTELPDGDFEVTVTLPPHTGAFYAYAEPDLFEDFAMSATAQDGTTSGPLTVYGDAGAQYFGFYANCGHALTSVTYTDSGGDDAMAVGEFGIAPEC